MCGFDQLVHPVRLEQIMMIQMLEQDGLAVGERQGQSLGRADTELRAMALEQAEIVIRETGGIEMRIVVQFQRVDDSFQLVVVHAGIAAAAAVEAADLDAAAGEDPGAGVTEIGEVLLVREFDPGKRHVGEGGAVARAALNERKIDVGPGALLAFDERLQGALGLHGLRGGLLELAGLHFQVAAGGQTGEADVGGTFMRQRQPPFGVADRVALLGIAVLWHDKP